MSTKVKIALSLALALGTASAAMAAPKHVVHHQRIAVQRQVPEVPGANAYGFANFGAHNPAPTDPAVLEALKRQAAGDPRCWGGSCDPIWTPPSD
jgi:hypothetical protein